MILTKNKVGGSSPADFKTLHGYGAKSATAGRGTDMRITGAERGAADKAAQTCLTCFDENAK